ncbi:hypothetical protein [Microbacterium sp. AK031]|uniref:hypothetical protein n=1 Tax=Microbacterium sp. AK031 TaxID=2723076 RepID=UPI002168B975|nr:hypothetical protein [Microbacterium sp. AK031]MCS3842972.1 MFS family permease [Microbacterium sp. AK031]
MVYPRCIGANHIHLGSIVLGHFGGRIGRKRMLVVSLITMGAATFAIGLLPTYAVLGVASPRSRAFLGSFPQVGLALGLTLPTLIFTPLVALPIDAFEGWG